MGLGATDASMETAVRYERLGIAVLAFGGLALVSLVLAVAAMIGGRMSFVVGAVALACFFSIVGVWVAYSLSDVVVSDTGIVRRLWGKTIAEIRWVNVRAIRVVQAIDVERGGTVRIFTISPITPAASVLPGTSRITFAERGDLRAIIEHMNRHIAARGIRVEVRRSTFDKAWTPADRIDQRP